jgi:hypothetical protein
LTQEQFDKLEPGDIIKPFYGPTNKRYGPMYYKVVARHKDGIFVHSLDRLSFTPGDWFLVQKKNRRLTDD